MWAATDNAYKLAKGPGKENEPRGRYLVRCGGGQPTRNRSRRDGEVVTTPAEALKMATADNGELMALSGCMDPYPGKLGVVEEGALADLLLVDGNPLENQLVVRSRQEKLSDHYEGWQDLQECSVQVRTQGQGRGGARCGEAGTGSRSDGQMFLCVCHLRRVIACTGTPCSCDARPRPAILRRCRFATC